jgi:putative intracellular protease/amidase
MTKSLSILIVTTSNAALGSTGKATGVWLEELTVPYYAFLDAGASVTVASIAGGAVPIDPRSTQGDPTASVKRFLADPDAKHAVEASPAIGALDISSFDAVFLPGGHGTMWDLPESAELAARIGQAYEAGKIVAAVCHGPAGLVSAKLADGSPIVAGKRVSAFTNEEEEAAGLTDAVPFLLETRLAELGAKIEKGPRFQPFAIRDGLLVTGQNPASSTRVAELVLEAAQR